MIGDVAAGHEACSPLRKPSSYPSGRNHQTAKRGEAILRDLRSGYALSPITQNRRLILIDAPVSSCLSRCICDRAGNYDQSPEPPSFLSKRSVDLVKKWFGQVIENSAVAGFDKGFNGHPRDEFLAAKTGKFSV